MNARRLSLLLATSGALFASTHAAAQVAQVSSNAQSAPAPVLSTPVLQTPVLSIPAITRQFHESVVQSQADGTARQMYDVDPSGYPANLSSTVPSQLTAAATGGLQPWNTATVQVEQDTELTFEGLMEQDRRTMRRNLLPGYGPIENIASIAADTFNDPPHPWLHSASKPPLLPTPGAAGTTPTFDLSTYYTANDTLGSWTSTQQPWNTCAEYTWNVWSPFMLAEDRASLCGGDAACAVEMLFEPGGPGSGAALAVAPTPADPNRPSSLTVPAISTRRPKNPFYGASANFAYAQDAGLLALANWCIVPSSGPQKYAQVPYSSSTTPSLNTAATQAEIATISALLAQNFTISYGSVPAGGPKDAWYPDEWYFDKEMMGETIERTDAISADVRLAMRQRAQHFQELLDQYTALTTFCALLTEQTLAPVPVVTALATASPTTLATVSPTTLGAVANVATIQPVTSAPTFAMIKGNGNGAINVLPPTLTPAEIVSAADALQDQIVEALVEEYDRGDTGCFSSTRVDCDWFPEDAAPRAMGAFTADREADFKMCTQWLPIFPNGLTGLTVGAVTTDIERTLAASKAALRQVPGIDIPVSSDPADQFDLATGQSNNHASSNNRQAMGQIIAGSKYYGDSDWFGGGYSYAAWWKVQPDAFPDLSSTSLPCRLDGEVHGELHASADFLSGILDPACSVCESQFLDSLNVPGSATVAEACNSINEACSIHYRLKHLADAQLTMTSDQFENNLNGDLFFAGEQIWKEPGTSLLTPLHETYPTTVVDGFSETVIVVVIPVTFELRGEAHYGVTIDASLANNAVCGTPNITASASFTPWAYVDAIGSVGVGFTFAQAGVRGTVRVVDANLPLNGKIWVDSDSLHATASANLTIGLLDGHISLFAQIGVPPADDESERELFAWRGYHDTIPIFSYTMPTIALPALDQGTWQLYQQGML